MIKRFAVIALVFAAVPGVATADFDLAASQAGTSGPVTITMTDTTADSAVATGVDLTLAFMPTGGAAGMLKIAGPITGSPFTSISGPTAGAFGAPGFNSFSLSSGATAGPADILGFSLDTSMVTTAGDFMVFAVTDAFAVTGAPLELSNWNDVNNFSGTSTALAGMVDLGPALASANAIKIGTISAVPEPSSFVLLGLVGAIIGVRRTSLISRLKSFFQA